MASEHKVERNPGTELDLAWIAEVQCNKSAIDRRAESHSQRRTVKKETQLGWLLRIVQLIDLTTLSGDDTKGNVERLCAKARTPIRQDFVTSLNVEDKVCSFSLFLPDSFLSYLLAYSLSYLLYSLLSLYQITYVIIIISLKYLIPLCHHIYPPPFLPLIPFSSIFSPLSPSL